MLQKQTRQSGFALILALLALLLLTSLGLSLSTTTGTELQISTNHRWTESARYNAEAGLDFGKQVLAAVPDWSTILPSPRPAWNATGASWPIQSPSPGSRSYENWKCDSRGYGMGYGLVLTDGGPNSPYQYVSTTTVGATTFTVNGAYTLWIRRPVEWDPVTGNQLMDYPGADVLVLVSEGVAPYVGALNTTALAATNRAVYTLETVISRASASPCEGRFGQAGGNAQGTNSYGCISTGGAGVAGALGAGAGTGALIP